MCFQTVCLFIICLSLFIIALIVNNICHLFTKINQLLPKSVKNRNRMHLRSVFSDYLLFEPSRTAFFKIFKLLTHNSALYRPTSVQLPQTVVASRVVNSTSPGACDDQWQAFCAAGAQTRRRKRVRTLKHKLKAWRKQGGAQAQPKKHARVRRTVFKLFKGGRRFKLAVAMKRPKL